MDDPDHKRALLTAVTTEHLALQSTAATTVTEAGARASLYEFSLSSFLVATGFLSESDTALRPFLATVMPGLFLLGISTVVRLLDTGTQNLRCLARIARIRRHYRSLAPEGTELFLPWESGEDDLVEALGMMCVAPTRISQLFSISGMVAALNSLVGGAGVALLVVELLGTERTGLGVVCGAGAALACMAVFARESERRFQKAQRSPELTDAARGARLGT
jgi:hypothetical protein